MMLKCKGFWYCEKNETLVDEILSNVLVTVYTMYDSIDFQSYHGEPVFQVREILAQAVLRPDKYTLTRAFMRQNSYAVFDGLINLEWPTKEGQFYDYE